MHDSAEPPRLLVFLVVPVLRSRDSLSELRRHAYVSSLQPEPAMPLLQLHTAGSGKLPGLRWSLCALRRRRYRADRSEAAGFVPDDEDRPARPRYHETPRQLRAYIDGVC